MGTKIFNDWDDALAYANELYNKGDISRNEIDKVARAEAMRRSGEAEKLTAAISSFELRRAAEAMHEASNAK